MNRVSNFIRYFFLLVAFIMCGVIPTNAQQEQKKENYELKKQESQLKIDSILSTIDTINPAARHLPDSLFLADSIQAVNQARLDSLNQAIPKAPPTPPNTNKDFAKEWKPNPTKATWYAIVFPGGGQIYNRKYWKLPIFYGGFAGCMYALNWNNTMYKDYSQAYRDLKDNNPNTNSYLELLPPNANIDKSRLETILKNRKDRFRRYRDLSVIVFVGVYVLSIIDAYVDAELSNFDITPDLSMSIEPTLINSNNFTTISKQNNSVGLQCKFTF